jgi:DNA-binding MurR/RpiR family transcriptional regulator
LTKDIRELTINPMGNKSSLLLVIKSSLASMHRVERAIAKILLEQPREALQMTVSQLAKAAGVADSSIVRFCKILGFESYIQMKLKLAAEIADPVDLIFEDLKKNDSINVICSKVFAANVYSLEETVKSLDMDLVDRAVNSLCKAKRIFFFGVGSSAPLAQDAYYRFMRIGLPAYSGTDPHISLISASMLDNNSVAVGISHTGRTKSTIRTLETAKEKGAVIIVITSSIGSPITEIADINLVVLSRESEYIHEAVSARIGHLAILDCLFACTAMRFHDKSIARTESYMTLLDEFR